MPRTPTAGRDHQQGDQQERRFRPAWFIGRRLDTAFQIREDSRTIAIGALSLIG
jgi:hypothetical protein